MMIEPYTFLCTLYTINNMSTSMWPLRFTQLHANTLKVVSVLTETENVIGISKERTAHITSLLHKVNIKIEVGNCFL